MPTFPLVLDSNEAAFLISLDSALEQAFLDGVVVPGGTPPTLAGVPNYDKLETDQRKMTRDVFKSVIAAMVSKFDSYNVPTAVSTFSNDYQPFGDSAYAGGQLRYWKDILGYVNLQGQVKTPASPGADQAITTLPAGYRPGPNDGHLFSAALGNSFQALQILSNGEVVVRGTPTGAACLSIDVRFKAGA